MSLPRRRFITGTLGIVAGVASTHSASAAPQKEPAAKSPAKPKKPAEPELVFPPQLPGGSLIVSDSSSDFLKPADTLRDTAKVATEAPTVDLLYYPGQDYKGKIWSVWGEGSFHAGKYYSAIGDHDAPAGTARVFEYDPAAKKIRTLLDLQPMLKMPEGHYSPSKIHSRVDMGSDGWLYCSTHRGSTTVTSDKYHYLGDWIVRCHPTTGQQEIVAHAPVAKHCIPTSRLDPDRMIFYGATSPGVGKDELGQFFAYDLKAGKVLYAGPGGPSRTMIWSRSTGKVYFTPGPAGTAEGPLMRFDPAHPSAPTATGLTMGLRAATDETADGLVYAASHGKGEPGSMLYVFNTKTEQLKTLVPAAVGVNQYVASMTVDGAGKYVYYVPGAHGGSEKDGTTIVQYNTRTQRKKVIAFLEPFYTRKYGLTLKGTYSVVVDPAGEKLFVTWNVSRGSKDWDCCALTVIHIPASERA